MAQCQSCGARLSANQAWCGQCYAAVGAPPGAAPVAVGSVAPSGVFAAPPPVAAPSRFGAAPAPAVPLPGSMAPPPPHGAPLGNPPPGWAPPRAVAPSAAAQARVAGRMLSGRAARLVAVAIGLVNHLLKLLVRHVLTQLLCNALQILEGDLACKLLIALNMIV